MAKMDFFEKEYFEQLFDMGAGYVLDFSNRTFQEFVYDAIQIDIYMKYPTLSTAKILRNVMANYDNMTVGTLLIALLRYMQVNKMVSRENEKCFARCAEIGNRLIGKYAAVKTPVPSTAPPRPIMSVVNYRMHLEALKNLINFPDTPQARGFAFEKYLYGLFNAHGLEPRESFRLFGEQIDGSFILHNEVYLLEAKWTNKQIGKTDLVAFNDKVASKSSFTRGVFISFSGYTDEALATFSVGRTVNIILLTVTELAIALTQQREITDLLWRKVRALAEEGNYNKSIFEM